MFTLPHAVSGTAPARSIILRPTGGAFAQRFVNAVCAILMYVGLYIICRGTDAVQSWNRFQKSAITSYTLLILTLPGTGIWTSANDTCSSSYNKLESALFGVHMDPGLFLPADQKLAPKWAWPGVRAQFRNFRTPSICLYRMKLHSSTFVHKCTTDGYCSRIKNYVGIRRVSQNICNSVRIIHPVT